MPHPVRIRIATDDIECTACAQNVTVMVTITLRTYTGAFTLGHLPDRAGNQSIVASFRPPSLASLLILSKNAKIARETKISK